MRKILTFEQRKLFELFSNFKYKMPDDPELILYDFYFLTSFGNKISGRDENANYAIEEASDDIVNQLYIHMKNAVFYALCAEIRHLFDSYNLEKIKSNLSNNEFKFLQEYYKQFTMFNGMGPNALTLELNDLVIVTNRDRKILSQETTGSRLASYKAIKATIKQFNWKRTDFALFAEHAFNSKGWERSFGGKPWADIADALYKLEEAKTKADKIIWIDHAYDLQHNTDTIFNKLRLYYKDGGYKWIKKALTWKKDVTDIRSFYNKVSIQLKPLVAYVSKVLTGKSIDTSISKSDFQTSNNTEINNQISTDITSSSGNYVDITSYSSNWINVQLLSTDVSFAKANQNKFKWLLKASLKDAKLRLDTVSKELIFESGIWNDGFWEGGIWQNGVWKGGSWSNGTWENGTWYNGTWYVGLWKNGVWKDGTWRKGTWEDGTWINGSWTSGTWYDGNWNNGIWYNGVRKNGAWYDGTWHDGTWEKGYWNAGTWVHGTWINGVWKKGIWEYGHWIYGNWKDGTWKDGTWKDGIWENGTWEDGIWYNGKWEKGYWNAGTWQTGLWKNGVWKDGVWISGTWKNGTWINGTWHNGTWEGGDWQNGSKLDET